AGAVHEPPAGPPRSALRPREALAVALTLGLVALLVGNAQRHYGDVGLELSVVLAALVDAHAPIASLAALHAAGELPTEALLHGVLLAVSANTVTRCGVAMVAGGRAYALRVGLALTVSLTLAWSVSWW
ncbi:DUF4010 domain-containing protein, partial [Methylibium sp. T29]